MTTRERPILFNAPMVRAILDGRKTQTRRPVKPQPKIFVDHDGRATWRHGKRIGSGPHADAWTWHAVDRCPYGQPGDRLWVREAWRTNAVFDALAPQDIPESSQRLSAYEAEIIEPRIIYPYGKVRPSIHMPRWASRITLEITDVRVQRVQDISEEDASAEGCAFECMTPTGNDNGSAIHGPGGFAALWDAAYPGSWNRNDWVWAVSFKRVNP